MGEENDDVEDDDVEKDDIEKDDDGDYVEDENDNVGEDDEKDGLPCDETSQKLHNPGGKNRWQRKNPIR